jgi:hypothetical protein
MIIFLFLVKIAYRHSAPTAEKANYIPTTETVVGFAQIPPRRESARTSLTLRVAIKAGNRRVLK